jgi:hypothetical protein
MGLLDRLFPCVARRKRAQRLLEAQQRAYAANSTSEAIAAAKRRWAGQARPCPDCGTPPTALQWCYYESSVASWEHSAGCFGWRTICPRCDCCIDEFLLGIS